MRRPLEQHLDSGELDALVPSPGEESRGLPSDAAKRHVASCAECREKVARYRELVSQLANAAVPKAAAPGSTCPKNDDIDWHDVAAGLWPEFKAAQLIQHAALCDHCGPLLRAAASGDDTTAEEEELLSGLHAPSRPVSIPAAQEPATRRWPAIRWLVPAMALFVIAGVLAVQQRSSPTPVSAAGFAELAAHAHRQHAEGKLALDVNSDSQAALNHWFHEKLPFALALPVSLETAGEHRPNRLEGARLLQISGKSAAYVAYQTQNEPVSLMIVPDSVARASGGVEVDFSKVSFHYRMVEGFRVVTWSLHGLTYALVSHEGPKTQQSCMVCHSAMKDRDLSSTPPPALEDGKARLTVDHVPSREQVKL